MSALGVVCPVYFPGSMNVPKVHCTLVYLGEEGSERTAHINRRTVLAATARLRSQVQGFNATVKGVELYGKGHCTVLTLDSITLQSWRKFLDRELLRDGIYSASEYSYSPHVTINKHDKSDEPVMPWPHFRVPPTVWIDEPVLWWGSDGMIL